MPQTVEVRFKGTRRGFYRWGRDEEPLRLEEPVIVPAERGMDLGRVSAVGDVAARKCGGCSGCGPDAADALAADAPAFPDIIRRAAPDEVRVARELRAAEEEDRRRIAQQARQHGLAMKVSDVEWQWDRQRLTVFFSAEQRVDFRALVRDLAAAFRARIDLRQIGVRDEAARLGGVGRCGREYCCSTWLTELSPVNLALAKDQHLSLNPTQISGGCGRLLCCLKYEHEFYAAARKRFPKEGKTLRTLRGAEKVVAVDIFRERVFLRGAEESRTIALAVLQDELAEAAALGDAPPALATAPAPRARPTERPRTAAAPPAQPPAPRSSAPAAPAPTASDGAPAPTKKRRRRRRRGPRSDGGGSTSPEP